ncbi:farnesyl pyrophosphate synthase-like [Octopus vulgaris]|uniref:Farnesyl pyrophosphate synthase-like n=2 Tax=Octopus TaxID=6643 RepID=A0AA36BVA3_OCTVU|nr:farnesyl pyrophosphate synthase-like [Octopus sinensis]XP_036369085.1 farnesyl pyrophosphate synthase-like [Octopus sinensis]CAI9740848.1 farnesyl pyrophosphate synthase-like [Octopus vulgaris]
MSANLSDIEKFDELFPVLLEDISTEWKNQFEGDDLLERVREVCSYNVPFGKKNRGTTVPAAYTGLMNGQVSEDDLRLARILGWCIEWLQAFFLVADDIMDNSVTRRGKPCWYRVENIGKIAINDSFFLEMSIYTLLRKYFRSKPYYVELLELFHSITSKTVMGQMLDLVIVPPDGKIEFEKFSLEKYKKIVKFKTAFYSFYLPVGLAMYMAGIKEQEIHNEAKDILLQMGEYFQIQDDYLDCFGDPSVTGKIGTDIEDGKCSWLVVQALSLVSDEQKTVLERNYGCDCPHKIQCVKSLYKELKLDELFLKYEEESYKLLLEKIEKCSHLPKEIFLTFAKKIYKRKM